MTNAINTNVRNFNAILDNFCGYNYHTPYWILLALYLRKENKLSIEENYVGPNINILSHTLTEASFARDLWENNISHLFKKQPANSLTVVGQIAGNVDLQNIVNSFHIKPFRAIQTNSLAESIVEFGKEDAASAMLIETAFALLNLDSQWFEENFLSLFDHALRRIFALTNLDQHFQPLELTSLASSILGRGHGRVYNPFAGIGSYGIALRNSTDGYLGEEVAPIISAIGNLRLMASNVNGQIQTKRALLEKPSCDAAIATPPFGVKVPLDETYDGCTDDYETLTLRKFAEMSVRSVTVVTDHVCTAGSYNFALRKELVSMRCVDTIISLPAGIFRTTGVKTSIVVLDSDHTHKGSIKFVDASNCFTLDDNKRKLDVSAILAILADSSSALVKMVSYSDIIANDFSFNPRHYLDIQIEVPEGFQLKSLGELGEIVRDRASDTESFGKFASFQSLVTTNRLKTFTPEDFVEKELPPHCVRISQDCVMMSGARGLRGVFVRPGEETLYCHNSYVTFIPTASNVLPLYIVSQLNEPYVLKQAELLASGATSGNLTRDALLKIKIAIPTNGNNKYDLVHQESTIQGYQDSLIKELGMEVENLRTKRLEEYQIDLRMRKHRIGQRFNEIIPSSIVLAEFIASQNGDFNKSAIVSDFSQTNLETYARKLQEEIASVADLISHFTDEDSFGEPENVDIIAFAEEYQRRHINDKYSIVVTAPNLEQEENINDTKPGALSVNISKDDLSNVFENICSNASEDGFIDPNRHDYAVRINIFNELVDGTPMVRIVIDNNGAPLPKGMTANKMFTWGVGKRSGIGTWQARHIIEHFGGSITFQQKDADDGFNIAFEILLPLLIE